jgi:hypothetical protein
MTPRNADISVTIRPKTNGTRLARGVLLVRSTRGCAARKRLPGLLVMRHLLGLMLVCALGVVPLLGCGQSAGNEATGGAGGSGVAFPCTGEGILEAVAAGRGPHVFACDGPTTVVTHAEIAIDNDVILDGEERLTVDGNLDHRLFAVAEGVTAELRGFVVTRGVAPLGGAIWNAGVLTLTNTTVSGSSAAEGGGIHNVQTGTMTLMEARVLENDADLGGGIFNDGTLTAVRTLVSENTAVGSGAGIFNERALTLAGSTLSDNKAGGAGGGISNVPGGDGGDGPGSLTLINSDVSWNTADFNGGGISSHGVVTLTGSTVSRNLSGSGGGIYNRGTLTGASSSVWGNSTQSCGGGIDNDGTVTLTNVTISGNTAELCGGGIYNQALLTVTSSTLAGNGAVRGDALGSDVDEKGGAASLANTLIDGDCDSDTPLISNGYNIESPGDTCDLDEAKGDQVGVTVQELDLGPLEDNGGSARTHAITRGSAAFNAIPEPMCQLGEDERGVTRPQGNACDVGAFELEM